MKITALAGGVGGAKFADGIRHKLGPQDLTIIVNTGDDFSFCGLPVCPDLDTVCYTLAGLANPNTGWGRAGDTLQAMQTLQGLGGPGWFNLGDLDLGLQLFRLRELQAGRTLSQVTAQICRQWGIEANVLPMSDTPVPTWVNTREFGELPFQEYFVKERCAPVVTGFRFAGVDEAQPAPGALEAIAASDAVVFCPSNPWVSIGPILAVQGMRSSIQGKRPVVAVSPLIGNAALKGPAAKMFTELGIEPSSLAVARYYAGLVDAMVIDASDHDQAPAIEALGMRVLCADIWMKELSDRARLAGEVLEFTQNLIHTGVVA